MKKEILMALLAILLPGGGVAAGLYWLNKLKNKKK